MAVLQAVILVAVAALILLGVKTVGGRLTRDSGALATRVMSDDSGSAGTNGQDDLPAWEDSTGSLPPTPTPDPDPSPSTTSNESSPGDEGASSSDPAQMKRYRIKGKGFTAAQKATAENIMNQFMDDGYTQEEAAAFVGNAFAESDLDPQRAQKNNGPGYGLFQWERGQKGKRGRLDDLMDFAELHKLDYRDENTQIQFALHELQGAEKNAASHIREAKGLKAKTIAVRKFYERPRVPRDAERIRGAEIAFEGAFE